MNELELLKSAGIALYGERWQSDIARALKINDSRRIRQWMAGERPIPQGVFNDLKQLLESRKVEIDKVLLCIEQNKA